MVDIIIKNGLVVTPAGVFVGGVAVKGKKIVKVSGDENLPQGKKEIDAGGSYIIPGFIDPHVHLGNDEAGVPFTRIRDDFVTETRGAVYGGVTTCLSYWCQLISYKEKIDQYIEWGTANSHINFGLHLAIQTDRHIEEIEDYTKLGVTSFKHFYNCYKGKTGQQLGHSHADPDMLYRVCEKLHRYGEPGIACIHCEEQDIIYYLEDKVMGEGKNDLKSYTDSRPEFTERMQMLHAMEIARATRAPLYIVHVSIGSGMEDSRKIRDAGYPIYTETCPHYLTHCADMEDEIGNWGKVNTPLRTRSDNEQLWRGIRNGGVTNMGTDHCPYKRESKQLRGGQFGNIWDSLPGICNGMEHWLPVMMTYGVNEGRISIEDMVRVCSTNNARAFGMYPQKGIIAEGSDADIVIVDPNKEAVIDENFYHTRSDWSIYYGWKVKGLATHTLVNGQLMLEERTFVGKPGTGMYIHRSRK